MSQRNGYRWYKALEDGWDGSQNKKWHGWPSTSADESDEECRFKSKDLADAINSS